MIESEAEKHICPFALARGDYMCAGSRCMAWVWKEPMPAVSTLTTALPPEKIIALKLVQTSMFPRPPGDGWQAFDEPSGPKSKETSQWTQEWKRDEEFAKKERHGDCGMKR